MFLTSPNTYQSASKPFFLYKTRNAKTDKTNSINNTVNSNGFIKETFIVTCSMKFMITPVNK